MNFELGTHGANFVSTRKMEHFSVESCVRSQSCKPDPTKLSVDRLLKTIPTGVGWDNYACKTTQEPTTPTKTYVRRPLNFKEQ